MVFDNFYCLRQVFRWTIFGSNDNSGIGNLVCNPRNESYIILFCDCSRMQIPASGSRNIALVTWRRMTKVRIKHRILPFRKTFAANQSRRRASSHWSLSKSFIFLSFHRARDQESLIVICECSKILLRCSETMNCIGCWSCDFSPCSYSCQYFCFCSSSGYRITWRMSKMENLIKFSSRFWPNFDINLHMQTM
jgi:hypothetical protein